VFDVGGTFTDVAVKIKAILYLDGNICKSTPNIYTQFTILFMTDGHTYPFPIIQTCVLAAITFIYLVNH
jgi:hypothetical protein